MSDRYQADIEDLKKLCMELFQTEFDNETPFGKSVIRRALYDRREKANQTEKKQEYDKSSDSSRLNL